MYRLQFYSLETYRISQMTEPHGRRLNYNMKTPHENLSNTRIRLKMREKGGAQSKITAAVINLFALMSWRK